MAPPKNSPAAGKKEGDVTAVANAQGDGAPGQPGGQVINLALLEIPQLQQLKAQVDQELNFYQEAIVQLKDVQMKMNESQTCLKMLGPSKKEMLVPVTGSMFVRGELADLDKVLVDIGTGYYVEKTMDDAINYFKRKVEFLGSQIEKVQHVGREKSSIRNAVLDVLEMKVAQIQAGQQAQQKKAIKT